MFIAKFNQVSSSKFTPNKHGQMPYIGTVLAGTSVASVIDATIFENGGNEPGSLYLCDNTFHTYEGKERADVQVIAKVSAIEFFSMAKELGAGKLIRKAAETVEAEAPVAADLV